jgi:parallel beta-helix repeat protein
MRATFIYRIILFFAVLSLPALAQTIIPGGVVSGTWTKANSPYLIQGAIMVADATVLSIEPGVKIEFQGSFKFMILGRLLAIGTAADSITFTAVNHVNGWLGVRFEIPPPANDTSRLTYCKFEYGRATDASPYNDGGALYFDHASKVVVSNSTISDCFANGQGGAIYCNKSDPLILNNKIVRNTTIGFGTIYLVGSSATVSGNTISYNNAESGGGVYCSISSNGMISGNIITYNVASDNAGGIACYNGASPTVYKNTISYNTAQNKINTISSGGIVCIEGSPKITRNTITYNISSGEGAGGIVAERTILDITNNIISHNQATSDSSAGGIRTQRCISGNILNNTIDNNHTVGTNGCGGAYFNGSDNIRIAYNFISNNSSDNGAGGIHGNNFNGTFDNNVVVNNSGATTGGGMLLNRSTPTLINNTIANNTASQGGGLFCIDASDAILKNNIVWRNTASVSGNQVYLGDEASDPVISYSDIQGGSAAFGAAVNVFYLGSYTNNINANPDFTSPSATSGTGSNGMTADWRISQFSLCMNHGDVNGSYPTWDIAGHTRVVDNIIDMGAYETMVTGIKTESDKAALNVYPNPSNGEFMITLEKMKLTSVEIYNGIGERIFSKQINDTKFLIDLKEQPVGVYFVHVIGSERNYVKKVIIQ